MGLNIFVAGNRSARKGGLGSNRVTDSYIKSLRVESRVIDSIVIVDLTWTGPPGARVQHCVRRTSPTGSVGWRLTKDRLVTAQRRVCNEVFKEEAASFARDLMMGRKRMPPPVIAVCGEASGKHVAIATLHHATVQPSSAGSNRI